MLKTATELIVESWDLYAKNWRKFLPFMILIFLPTLVLSALGTISLYLEMYIPSSSLASNILILIIFAASLVFTIWVTVALAKTMLNCLQAKPTEWKETFSASSNLIWPVILTSFLVTLIVLGGTLLLIIPGIIFAVWYSFASYVVIFEGVAGLDALRASKALVVGRWWPVVWRLAISTLVFGFLNSALAYVLAFLIRLLPLPLFIQSASASALVSLAGAIVAPLSAGAILILYQSAKQNPVTSLANTAPFSNKNEFAAEKLAIAFLVLLTTATFVNKINFGNESVKAIINIGLVFSLIFVFITFWVAFFNELKQPKK